MFRKIFRGCLLALLACPVMALAEPIYSVSFLPAGFNATAMNGSGHIVGNTAAGVAGSLSGEYGQPFLYTSGLVRHAGPALDEEFQAGRANGLNDLGQVAGEYATLGGGGHAWVDANGSVRMPGTLRGMPTWSVATAINKRGQVVGGSTYDGAPDRWAGHAFLYQDGTMHDLVTLGGWDSFANDINDAGQAVGWAQYAEGEARDAFLFAGKGMSTLNRLVQGADGWTVVEAYDINDARQILGKACRDGECLSVRLDLVSAVPEPGSYALLTARLVLLAGWRTSGRRDSLRFS